MAGKPLLLTAESEDKVALQAFQFTPLCWKRHAMPESDVPDSPFQSTLPCAGGDTLPDNRQRLFNRFQSTPPCAGGDDIAKCQSVKGVPFQSTPPCAGGDLTCANSSPAQKLFQSTPPCAGGDIVKTSPTVPPTISIHAPLCGGRPQDFTILSARHRFQSTPPCAGGDIVTSGCVYILLNFNPRPPVRGATAYARTRRVITANFNPRPPVRGATRIGLPLKSRTSFQSTPPCAGGDYNLLYFGHTVNCISIHAPLCGGRPPRQVLRRRSRRISIHAPLCGGRRRLLLPALPPGLFQSTPPCAGGDSCSSISSVWG